MERPGQVFDSGTGALRGRSVLVTRRPDQSAEITSLLEKFGARVIHLPTIEVIEPGDWRALDGAIDRLEGFDWVVFTSSNGAEFFFRRLREKRPGALRLLAGKTVCAIGPATAKAIEAQGLGVDLIAKDSKAEGALRAILERAGGSDKVRGLRFLIPRARVARELLPAELGRLGAFVEAVEAYQTVKPDTSRETILKLFTGSAIDAVTFTSSSTVSNLASMVGMSDLSSLTGTALIACIGPVTAATAREHGLKNIVEPDAYTAAALVEALVRSMGKTKQ